MLHQISLLLFSGHFDAGLSARIDFEVVGKLASEACHLADCSRRCPSSPDQDAEPLRTIESGSVSSYSITVDLAAAR